MDDLKLIKKYYGENMMHLCRDLFPTLLEQEGKLFSLLDSNFQHTNFLYECVNQKKELFKNYIFSMADEKKDIIDTSKGIYELMDTAGYDLYECKTDEDVQKFRKYYQSNEALCTFWTNRTKTNYVFFAVKKNVDEIKRENFENPERQDEYGTSVISIQFTKGNIQTISIKNRYNHTVSNPDATFSNNLDNIIPGLTTAFIKEKGYKINQENMNSDFGINLKWTTEEKYYYVNFEQNNISYGPNNIIIDNSQIIDTYQEKEKYIVMEYFILDLINKKIFLYDNNIKDDFINHFDNIQKIQIQKLKDNNTKKIILTPVFGEDIIIELNNKNRIIGYKNNNIKEIGDNCLASCFDLKWLCLDNVIKIGNFFASSSWFLDGISMNSLKTVGSYFLNCANGPEKIFFPKLEEIDNYFMDYCKSKVAILPNVKKVGKSFFNHNKTIEEMFMPQIEKAGNHFLVFNNTLKSVFFPLLKYTGECFLRDNRIIEYIDFPALKKVGDDFMTYNEAKYIHLPNLEIAGNSFLERTGSAIILSLPKLKTAGNDFLQYTRIKYLYAPNLETVGENVLYFADELEEADLSNLKETGYRFMHMHTTAKFLSFPNLESLGDSSLSYYKNTVFAPKLMLDDEKLDLIQDEKVFQKKLSKMN